MLKSSILLEGTSMLRRPLKSVRQRVFPSAARHYFFNITIEIARAYGKFSNFKIFEVMCMHLGCSLKAFIAATERQQASSGLDMYTPHVVLAYILICRVTFDRFSVDLSPGPGDAYPSDT